MSKFFRSVLVFLLSLMTGVTFAQQLPDPGFEDWGGAQFDGKEQPKYWNFSNVEQLGVKRNFAHKTSGISGNALKIQDQFVGVGSIGATSPGYVALGHPWAYVSSLTSIEDATAGTYGGISWKYRPDSMVVWIKRYYDSSVNQAAGDHTKDENFNLMYYAWSGTSKGTSYKAKNLSCTDISGSKPEYCVNEESDIRQALDGNECGTKVQAKQVAEGWYYEKKAYPNWTRIAVPIYYFNDDVPEMCNVILSAGRYPDFRANNGQNAGNSMDVDNISLVYSSKIQKLYINKKEWKAFNPNTTEVQTYSLGQGATTIPEISAVRGAGSLTNTRGGKATFPGRRLTDKECVIKLGTVDGEPTTITVKAEDGSSTTTYTIKFVSQSSDNARLSDIRVNGQSVSGFNAYLTSYNVALPYGTTDAPTVEVTTQEGSAKVQIDQATSPTGKAVITVTAGDGTTTMTYTVNFSVAALSDVTLKAIYVDGNLVPGFVSSKSNYVVSLPLSTTTAPKVTWESAYAEGVQTIKLLSNTLEGGAQIQVSLPGTTTTKTYKLTYKIEASSYSYLAGIALDGVALEWFAPEKTVYTVSLPMGATSLPAITWTQGDPYQTVKLTEGGVDGISTIEVKAASGATTTYRLTFQTEKSSNTALAGIALDGEALEGFDPEILEYTVTLPAGSSSLPTITYTTSDDYQKVSLFSNLTQMTARLTVTAGDGSTRVYKLNFELEKYANALLQMIYLDGKELSGFEPEILDYSLVWSSATMPKVTVLPNPGQAISIASPATYGTVRIVVSPEEGAPMTYTVRLNSPDEVALPPFPTDAFKLSDNAQLAELYIDGKSYEAFKPDQYAYTYSLPQGTYQVPAVMAVAGAKGQTITIAHGAVNRPTVITVLAADKKTQKDYTVLFTAPRSSNTALASVEIEGVEFTFDPAKKEYKDIVVPYGITGAPSLIVERAEDEQSLVITEAPIGSVSTIVVTAEDGTQATYSFSYQLTLPEKKNELLGIVVDGYGALDMSQGPDFTIDLPYGYVYLDIVSITKSYPEQQIVEVNGGMHETTTLTVKSLNPAEPDMVYTITPHVGTYDPATLTDLKVNGETLAQFKPDVYNYVVATKSATPIVTYTAPTYAEVETDENDKRVLIDVAAFGYSHQYTVTFYYQNDATFDTGFESWQSYTNAHVNVTGSVPTGWYSPLNAETSGGTTDYDPNDYLAAEGSQHTQGSKAAKLMTAYLLASAESLPGFLSLSQPTITIGSWYMVTHTGSTLMYGAPIPFRNTPDQVQLDYNLEKYNKLSGWRFIYKANQQNKISYSGAFSGITKGQWNTLTQDLTYEEDFVPENLDILISAAPSDNLADYYIGTGGISDGNKFTSTMYVDNLRLIYNSALKGITVNGKAATLKNKAFTAKVDADSYGRPEIVFEHAVADQMPVVSWLSETNRVRVAQIRNYAEDLSFTDYTMTISRATSNNVKCTYTLTGRDLKVTKGSPYQTISVTTNDTAYVITVLAESGAKKEYYASWKASESSEARVTTVEAVSHVTGVSTARLINLVEQPVVNYSREYALDSVVMITTDTCHTIHVFGTDADTAYVIARNVSRNALLASMSTNHVTVPGFYEETYDYVVTLASMDAFEAVAQDPEADVQHTFVPIDNEHTAVFVQVTAADGFTQKRYSIMVKLHEPSNEAYLLSITADDAEIAGFKSNVYSYQMELPAESNIPQLASVVCAGATVEMTTTRTGSSAVVTFDVTAEDGKTTKTYTVNIHVMPSAVCTLSNLFVGDGAVEGFAPDQFSYSVELPYGTTELPIVDYTLTNKHSTAVVETKDRVVTVTVTAEDGTHTQTYTVTFTIAKSTNANLKSITLDTVALANFFAEEYNYTVQLPYGAALPTITAESEDPAATVVINGNTITVTAEDGKTTKTYTLTFTFAPSENAYLLSIELDGKQQSGFAPEIFEYTDTVYFGSPMPVVTWTVGDEQQQVDTAWTGDEQLLITVTAGDGLTTAEYTLTFVHMLSPNCYLKDLQVRGVTIDGFRRDSLEYTILYPVGTDSAALCGVNDIVAIPEEKDATVAILMENGLIQIFVTAPNGDIKVYTISQRILLSSEARLKMIWLDSTEVRDFHSDSLTYRLVIPQGAILPLIDAEPIDSLAKWELGMETEIENGKRIEIYVEAQDGSTLTYTLNFVYANWAPSGTVDADDYLFFYAGDGQYKAVTIGVGVQLAIYDMNGALQKLETLPVADPADVVVEVDTDGAQRLIEADRGAQGVLFTPQIGKMYFYVFFDSKTKRIAKGGKFILNK